MTFLQVSFSFQYQSINLSDFPLTSFHLAEALLLYLLHRGLILLCVQLSKNIKKCLLYIIIHIFSTFLVLILQSMCFISTT